MKYYMGYSTVGMRRLIVDVIEGSDMTELQRLIVETRCRVAAEWEGYEKGLRMALVVFDDM